MNALTVVKGKLKKKSVVVGSAVGGLAVVSASTASAALDLTPVTAAIATAITDITSAALILVGAYAAVWGVKQMKALFAHG